jgi:hypothetical protein
MEKSKGEIMAKVKLQPYAEGRQYVIIFCPACQQIHTINHAPDGWGFNGSLDKPTFEGSIGFHGEDSGGVYCHSLIKDGMIEYLPDCGHSFAGQTLELPDL